jgi:prepilin-type N-terminal cleavage/methylation domain-containing protein
MKRGNRPFKDGFTLIETLVALGILAVIVVVATSLFFSMLKGASKMKAMQTVKQNGGYAIAVMERLIRNASQIVECQADQVRIKSPDEKETNFHFCGEPDFLIASESGTLTCSQNRLTSSEVKLISGSFTCLSGEGLRPDVVGINFSLAKAGLGVRPEEEAAVSFQTSVSLRNY